MVFTNLPIIKWEINPYKYIKTLVYKSPNFTYRKYQKPPFLINVLKMKGKNLDKMHLRSISNPVKIKPSVFTKPQNHSVLRRKISKINKTMYRTELYINNLLKLEKSALRGEALDDK